MHTEELETLKYPIGRFQYPQKLEPSIVAHQIDQIASLPGRLTAVANELTTDQLDTAYRPGGWTLRQVIHHLPDSHLNSYIRFKWTLTEDLPTIKAYKEALWAELPDGKCADISYSLRLLESLHARWVIVLRQLTPEDLMKRFVHPEHTREIHLYQNISLYAWHGEHHLAHINGVRTK